MEEEEKIKVKTNVSDKKLATLSEKLQINVTPNK
jgi:hypothetical protein